MKKIIVFLVIGVFMIAGIAFAGERRLKPRHRSFGGENIFGQPGSHNNPYDVIDEDGNKVGEIRSRYHDYDPDDGYMEPGSDENPLVETDE